MDQYIGRLLDDRYEILEVIGTGGMAVVYKARCHRLNRLVAIKILKDEFSGDEEFRRRFRAEGQAVAMLSHPNIVQVYDVSSSYNCNFIVMELIDGISLKQYMEAKGVLNWKETLHFAMQIAQGLEHAHSRGIIHRDIKPHNVMVLKNGSVKVMDFGIARVMSKSNTLTKEALGSVHYISPEQAKGGYTDNRSDIYSLSVVMYEMMTGRPPYDGESPVAVAIQHINGGAIRPSALNPNIPRGLEQIIQKGMALDVNERYSSASEMLRDMEEFRKNPDILFDYHTKLTEATRPLPQGMVMVDRSAMAATGPIRRTAPSYQTDPSTGGRPPVQPVKSRSARTARQRREAEKRRKKRSRIAAVAIVFCSVVAMVAMVMFLMALFNGALLNQEKDLVEVPFLIGQVYDDDFIREYVPLRIRLQPQEYDDTFAKGQIMHQEPAGGSKVVPDTELWITVSMGKEQKEKYMENLVDVDLAQAQALLEGQKFQIIVRYDTSDEYEAGQVIKTQPAAGSPLTDGQVVSLWVSTGPKVILKKMPQTVGLEKQKAIDLLKAEGFENVQITEVFSQEPEGTVVSQSEPRYKELDVTTTITLEVSKGLEETNVEVRPMIYVVGFGKDVALQELQLAGFDNITLVEVMSDRQTGRVVGQSVAEGKEIPVDTPITLEISKGEAGVPGITKVRFSLPLREESFILSIRLDGKEIMEAVEIPAGQTEYTMELTGTGSQVYELLIDGELYMNQKVTFDTDE